MARPSATGSRASTEPQDRLGPPGFDPARMDAAWLVNLIVDYGGGYIGGRDFCDSNTFQKRYPEFVAFRTERRSPRTSPSEAIVETLIAFAEAIATEAGTATTVEQGVVHEGAGRRHRPEGASS